MNFEILKAREDDWEDAMHLAYRVFMKYESEEYGAFGTENFLEFISCQELRKMFLIGEYQMIVAKFQGEVVGMISLRSGNHISLLFVDSAYHRCGIASQLMNAMIAYLKNENRYRDITVNASPYGIPFYKNYGFFETDQQIKKDGIIFTPMKYSF